MRCMYSTRGIEASPLYRASTGSLFLVHLDHVLQLLSMQHVRPQLRCPRMPRRLEVELYKREGTAEMKVPRLSAWGRCILDTSSFASRK